MDAAVTHVLQRMSNLMRERTKSSSFRWFSCSLCKSVTSRQDNTEKLMKSLRVKFANDTVAEVRGQRLSPADTVGHM